ncbi:hypothetical protein [Leptolyngbya sp. FACHB-261]|uniref:hypothetical protein n=1 Tax=Leptolyngbya sp. FACHB-261 TaxID=2692806 RepID=UPI0018F04C45|nr:hypothetical protein [Leptolyngbya sp. FACHB-261]
MAVVDLEQIALVKDQIYDSRLSNFHKITTSTIILELLGFYSSSISLGWGAVLVLLSQVWFNLLAGIQLQPLGKVAIQPSAISERLPVLIANGIGLILVSLWLLQVAPLSMASGLLGLVIFYIWVKYAPAVLKVK